MCSFPFHFTKHMLNFSNAIGHANAYSYLEASQLSLISHCAPPLGQLGYTSMRNMSPPHWPLYLMFAMERTCCCVFPTVRGALKIKIFQISAKRWHAGNWFSIVAKQQGPRPALPLFGAVSFKKKSLVDKNVLVCLSEYKLLHLLIHLTQPVVTRDSN